MVKPESRLISPSLYKAPTNDEIFGLKKPFPAINRPKLHKRIIGWKCHKKVPYCHNTPPSIIAFL